MTARSAFISGAMLCIVHATASGATPVASAQGRIEGASETVHPAFAATGQISEILVTEGQLVKKGDVLARLRCGDREADYQAAVHMLAAKEDEYRRARRGARAEERSIAGAEVQRIAALLTNARSELRRYNELVARQQVPVMDTELRSTRVRDLEEQLTQSLQKLSLAKSPLLPEEDSRWKNEVAASQSRMEAAQQRLGYCELLAPAKGIVIRIHLHEGEAVSETIPAIVMDIADTSHLRVRVEIDERDVVKVTTGSRAEIRVDQGDGSLRGIGDGKVTWLAPSMGKRQVVGTDPIDSRDGNVREALVDFGNGTLSVPVGLKVNVSFTGPADGP